MTEEKLPPDGRNSLLEPLQSPETFVSERLRPEGVEFALPAAIGEPALPLCFAWQQRTYEVREVVRKWKESDPDRTHGSGQLYLRRHWFELRMADGTLWTVYLLRQPASRRQSKARWWLYGISRPTRTGAPSTSRRTP